jgi:hypothetical protein
LNKLEAFKELAKGKKVRASYMSDDSYYYLDNEGDIVHYPKDEASWSMELFNSGWTIYEPPKKKVKKKITAWVYTDMPDFWDGLSIHSIYKDECVGAKKIEFEVDVDEN